MKRTSVVVIVLLTAAGCLLAGPLFPVKHDPLATPVLSPLSNQFSASHALAPALARKAQTGLVWTDNPAETLHYDGPNDNNGVGLTDGGTFYGAARFTPVQSCSVKTALFLHYMVSSDEYVFIFGPGTSTSPGPVLDSMPYTGADSGWISLNLNTPILVPGNTDFWVGVRLTHPAGVYPFGVDAGPMVQDRGGFVNTPGDTWSQLNGVGLDVNWNLQVVVEPVRFPDDVGTEAILAPLGMVTEDTIVPVARIRNFGLDPQGPFDVRLTIDPGGYTDTRSVASLAPDDTIQVTFNQWIPGGSGGRFTVKCTTLLEGDAQPGNDAQTASALTVSFLQDFEANNGGYVFFGAPEPNWGWGAPESPRPAPHSGASVWAAPLAGEYPNYAQWQLRSVGYVALQDTPVIVFYHWYNFEARYDGGNVNYSTDGGATWTRLDPWAGNSAPYDDSVYTLGGRGYTGPGPSDWLLAMFQVPVASGTMFYIRWDMGTDVSITHLGWMIDDVAGIGCNTVPNDVGTEAVTSPTGLVAPGTYQPTARIRNYGTDAQGPFDVVLKITPGTYTSTRSVASLAPYDTVTLTFADWVVADPGIYTLRCSTELGGDAAPGNDARDAVAAIASFVLDFESSNGGYTADPSSGAWTWGVPESPRPGAHSGTNAWGAPLGGNYINDADWRLQSVTYEADVNQPIIAFWHWYSFERTYDGGNIKYSTDGGANWTLIEPWAAYSRPYDAVISTMNLAIGGQLAYTGDDQTWRLAWFQVPVDSGTVFQVRWHMGTDPSVTSYYGWLVDDVAGIGLHMVSGIAAGNEPRFIDRLSASPNPVSALLRIDYSLARAGYIRLCLYDATGRLVRTLDQGNRMPGNLSSRVPVSDLSRGVYLLKLESGTTVLTRKVVIE